MIPGARTTPPETHTRTHTHTHTRARTHTHTHTHTHILSECGERVGGRMNFKRLLKQKRKRGLHEAEVLEMIFVLQIAMLLLRR